MPGAVVAFCFGTPATLASNQLLSRIAKKKAQELGALIYTEPAVDCHYSLEIKVVDKSPASTLRLSRAAARQAKKNKVGEIWIVACPYHTNRCLRDMKFALEEIGFFIPVYICEISEDIKWFLPNAEQWQARSENAWHKRNGILMLMPMWLYTRIAS